MSEFKVCTGITAELWDIQLPFSDKTLPAIFITSSVDLILYQKLKKAGDGQVI